MNPPKGKGLSATIVHAVAAVSLVLLVLPTYSLMVLVAFAAAPHPDRMSYKLPCLSRPTQNVKISHFLPYMGKVDVL